MGITTKQLNNKGILVKATGLIDIEDLITITREIGEDKESFLNSDYAFNDLSEVSKFNVTTEKVLELAKLNLHYYKIHPEYRIVVYTSSDLIFGLSRLWTSYLGSVGPRVYLTRNKGKASEWLSAELGREISLP